MESIITYYPRRITDYYIDDNSTCHRFRYVDMQYNILINTNDLILQFITEHVMTNIGRLITDYTNIDTSSYQKFVNRKHGSFKKYYKSNKLGYNKPPIPSVLSESCNYNLGRKDGVYHKYNRQGNIVYSIMFDNNRIIEEYKYNKHGNLVLYVDRSQQLQLNYMHKLRYRQKHNNGTNYWYCEYILYSLINEFIKVVDTHDNIVIWSRLHLLFESYLCYDLINIVLIYY
jgi:hypothetical protein